MYYGRYQQSRGSPEVLYFTVLSTLHAVHTCHRPLPPHKGAEAPVATVSGGRGRGEVTRTGPFEKPAWD